MAEQKAISIDSVKLLKRWGQLKSERASWIAHWQEISGYLLPRNGRFFVQDRNRGGRKHNLIYDSTGTKALRILGAGMMAGASSPARPWFRLETPDPSLNAFQPVKLWLDDVTKRMQHVFSKGNTYRSLHQMYEELGAFGTAASIVLPDFDHITHHYPLTIGEYVIAHDWQGKVCTLYREFQKTVSELVKEFGYESCSKRVQKLYDTGMLDSWITVIHAIEPREDRNPAKRDAKNMPFGSYYFELGCDPKTFLRESGYKRFPVVVPRWSVVGGDIYGNCPGMEALGDVKQLQHEQLRKAQGIDYQTKPPLSMPLSMKGREVDTLPGGVTYRDSNTEKIESMFKVELNLQYLLADIQDCRQRINSNFFADLFLLLANAEDTRMTATEVAERHEEKLLMLGPVLERLHNELLEPLVDITFQHMLDGGLIPPAPKELQGMPMGVTFVSLLAQAQKAIGINSMDRFTQTLTGVAQIKPEVLDKFDADEWVNSYGDMLNIEPKVIVGDDQVAQIRDARNKAQAAQQQAAAMEQQSQTAKNFAAAPTGGGSNALRDLMNNYSGYGSPDASEVQ